MSDLKWSEYDFTKFHLSRGTKTMLYRDMFTVVGFPGLVTIVVIAGLPDP